MKKSLKQLGDLDSGPGTGGHAISAPRLGMRADYTTVRIFPALPFISLGYFYSVNK
jgi:hypothetical protein